MKYFSAIIIFSHVILLISTSFHPAASLKCRTGNQQSDDQFQKIMQVCRHRVLGYDRDGGRDFNGRDTDSQESSNSDSEEDVFDNKFLNPSGSRYSNRMQGYNNNNNNDNGRYDYAGSSSMIRNTTRRNWNDRSDSGRSNYDGGQTMNNNRRNMRNSGNGYNNNGGYGDNGYSNSNRYNNNNSYGSMNRNNNNNNNDMYDNDGEREQAVRHLSFKEISLTDKQSILVTGDFTICNSPFYAYLLQCVTQCFFNELNLVDQRGYPERSAVTSIMTKNIMDPELRDFVEESVIECFHYLANNGRQEKCQFSQNLLSCLAEKGSERCEDWDDN